MKFKENEEHVYRLLPLIPGVLALALFIDGVVVGSTWKIAVGLIVVLIATWSPRLRGKVEIALGALKFKGELTTPPEHEHIVLEVLPPGQPPAGALPPAPPGDDAGANGGP